MKRLFLALFAVLLVGCHPEKGNKAILLTAEGSVEIAPDEATLLINTTCVNREVKQARACLIEVTSGLDHDLASFGIPKEDILTTGVSLSKEYAWRDNSEVFIGYRASTTITLRARDLAILDDLYSTLLGNEKLALGPLTYGHSKMDSINNVAYLKALENANELADQILSQMPEKNKTITRVSNFQISGGGDGPDARTMKLGVSEALDRGTLTINLGNIIVSQQLYVEYSVY